MDTSDKANADLSESLTEGTLRVYVHFRNKPPLQRVNAMKRAGIVVRSKWTPYLLKGVLYYADDIPGYVILDVPKDKLSVLERKEYVARLETPWHYEKRVEEEQRLAKMPFCPNCGPVSDESAMFCARCSRQLYNARVCAECGAKVEMNAVYCYACGIQLLRATQLTSGPPSSDRLAALKVGTEPLLTEADYPEEVRYADRPLPEGVRGWSWGALWLGLLWGLCNRVWISLLLLIPYVNIVMIFVLAAKGKEWAWKAGTWRSVRHFRKTQHNWSIVGWIYFLASVLVGFLIGFMMAMEGY